MNLYRKFIAIFICLFVNYGYKPAESVLKISHGPPSTPSEGSDPSQSVPAEGASTTPAHGTSSVPSAPPEPKETAETSNSEENKEITDPSSDGAVITPPPKSEDPSASTTPTKKASETHSSPTPIKTFTPKTGVDLNIKSDTKATNKFEYEKAHLYVTYTSKDNYAFKLVKEGSTEIWRATDNTNYSVRVEVEHMITEGKGVTIYLPGNKTKVFKKDGKNDPWTEIDTSKVNPKGLNTDYCHETHFYKNKLKNNVRTFTTRGGFAFKGANEYVNNEKVEIWKTENESEYVNKIEVDLMNNDAKAVTICFAENKTKVFTKSGKKEAWNEIDTTKVHPKSVDITDDNDTYFYSSNLQDSSRTFESKNGFAINVVKEGTTDIWKTNSVNEYANKIVLAKRHSGILDVTIHMGNGNNKLFIKENSNDPWKQIDLSKATPKSVNIQYQYDSYFYTNRLDNNVRTFEARHGFAFNGFREGENDIWTTTDESEYANKVVSAKRHSGNLDVTIHMVNGGEKLFIKETENDTWKEIDLSKVSPSPVNIDYPYESYFYKNELKGDTKTFTAKTGFAFNGANKYVNNKKIEIWKTDNESEYANKIVSATRSPGKLDVTIHMDNGNNKLFVKEKEDEGWKEIDLTIINPRSMNIRYDKETYFYSNKLDNDVRTFEARDGFAFNVINEYIGNNRVEIWTTTNESEYAKKVVAGDNKVTIYRSDGIINVFNKASDNNWNEDKAAATKLQLDHIAQPEQDTSSTDAEGDDSTQPQESTDSAQSGEGDSTQPQESTGSGQSGEGAPTTPADPSGASTQPKVKLFKVNPDDAANPLELDVNEYTLTQSGDVVSYQINVDCVQLMLGNDPLWVYDSTKHGGIYPKSVYHDTTTDVLLLRFDGLDITFQNTNEGWIFTESGPLAVKFYLVDPNDPNNSVELDSTQLTLSQSGDVTTFNIANGVNSIALTYGPFLLWQHDPNQHEGKHPKSLYYSETTDTLVLRFEGLDLTFAKNDQGLWEYTETATSGGGASTQPKVKLFKVNPDDAANPLELDVNEYTLTQSGDVVSYQINVDCVQLMLGNDPLWVYDSTKHGGIYPKSVYHDTTTDVLLLRFDGLDITFQNTNEGWIFTESGPLAVKFYLVDPNDPNNSVELDSTQLTLSQSGDVTTFNIANGVNSIALTYGPFLLWQHDPNQHEGKHPKSLYYSETTDTLVLRFEGLDLTFAKNDQGLWEYTETATSGGGASTQPKVKLFKVNPDDAANPLELDVNEYTLTQSGDVVSYQINVDCVQLMLGNDPLWVYDSTKHGGIYPKSVYHDTTTDVLLLRFDGLDITFQNTNEGWIFTESGPLAVKFYLVDPNDPNNSVELDSTQLTLSQSGDVTTFNIANGVNSIALTYGPFLLWQHDPNQHEGKHPKSLYYSETTDTLVLRFEGLDLTFAKNDQGLWEYTETATSGGGAAITPKSGHIAQPGGSDGQSGQVTPTTSADHTGASTQPKSDT